MWYLGVGDCYRGKDAVVTFFSHADGYIYMGYNKH